MENKTEDIKKVFTEEMFCMLTAAIFKGAECCNECLRRGQYIYNQFYHALEHFEPEIKTLSDKSVDCYYLDNKIDDFVQALRNEVVGKEYIMGYKIIGND